MNTSRACSLGCSLQPGSRSAEQFLFHWGLAERVEVVDEGFCPAWETINEIKLPKAPAYAGA